MTAWHGLRRALVVGVLLALTATHGVAAAQPAVSDTRLIGAVMLFAGPPERVPDGWMVCDGRSLPQGRYAALYGVIGTIHGGGAAPGSFRIPDLRGRTALGAGRGADLSARELGARVGRETAAAGSSSTSSRTRTYYTASLPTRDNPTPIHASGQHAHQVMLSLDVVHTFARAALHHQSQVSLRPGGEARGSPRLAAEPHA